MVGAVALLAAGCAGSPPDPAQVTGLHFTASSSLASNPPPAVEVTLDDVVAARTVYRDTLALPEISPGTYNCPVDLGVIYRMDFTSGATVAITVTAQPGGCQQVKIPGTNTRRAIAAGYWAALAQNLGIAESAIYPYPPPQ